MTVGLTIPGVPVVHPREEWQQDGYRMERDFHRVPTLWRADRFTRPACHYSSAINLPDGDVGEFDYQIIPWLRATQRDYYTNRTNGGYTRLSDGRYFPGYPIGYQFGVDWLGGAWELRGFDYQEAATAGHNGYAFAILMITDRHDPASELAWATARAIWREARRRSRRTDVANRPWGHGEFYANTGVGTPTICPGPPVLAQLHAGLGDLNYDEGGPDMGALTALLNGSERAYDSRPGAPIDAPYQTTNGGLPRAPLLPGQPRRIFIGLAVQAEINLTAIGKGGAGYLVATPGPELTTTSTVNYDGTDRVEANTQTVALRDGRCYVHCVGDPCDFAVDVNARG